MTRLLLLIGADAYDVSPLPGGSDVRRAWRLRKVGTESAYDVCERGSGDVTCDCADFVYRRKSETRGRCKHGTAVAAYFSPVFAAGHLGER